MPLRGLCAPRGKKIEKLAVYDPQNGFAFFVCKQHYEDKPQEIGHTRKEADEQSRCGYARNYR